jgi:hypothetical protein
MILSEAIEAVGNMLKGYAYSNKTESGYIGAIAAMLCWYPRQVAMKCADPIRGLARTCKFLPTPADIVAWCEKEAGPLYQAAERERRASEQIASRERPIQADPEMRARIVAGLAELSEQLKRGLQPTQREQSAKTDADKARTARRIAQITAEWGDQEVPTLGGTPVSRELVATMQMHREAAE